MQPGSVSAARALPSLRFAHHLQDHRGRLVPQLLLVHLGHQVLRPRGVQERAPARKHLLAFRGGGEQGAAGSGRVTAGRWAMAAAYPRGPQWTEPQ